MEPQSLSDKIHERRIDQSDTILVSLKRMDQIDRKLLLVFSGEQFTGLISIGDIQRAIIANKPMNTQVGNIIRSNIRVARTIDDPEEIRRLMLQHRTECMPVLDENDTLAEVIFWEDLFPHEARRMEYRLGYPVVIMAGGKGTRLKPFTNILPKPLMPLGEKTILEHIMDRFTAIHCDHFYLSVNYKADMIRYYLDTLNNSTYHIEYFQEEKPLGTAGSLFLLKGILKTTFFVSNCDILIEEDYGSIAEYNKEQGNELTLVAALRHLKIPYGTVETAEGGQLTSLIEKPEVTFKINSGLYILEPHLLNEIPENTFFNITDLIEKIKARKGKVGVFPVSENSWRDVGEWLSYLKYNKIDVDDHSPYRK